MTAKRVTRGELSQSLPRLNGPVHGAAEKLSDGSTSEEKLSDGSTVEEGGKAIAKPAWGVNVAEKENSKDQTILARVEELAIENLDLRNQLQSLQQVMKSDFNVQQRKWATPAKFVAGSASRSVGPLDVLLDKKDGQSADLDKLRAIIAKQRRDLTKAVEERDAVQGEREQRQSELHIALSANDELQATLDQVDVLATRRSETITRDMARVSEDTRTLQELVTTRSAQVAQYSQRLTDLEAELQTAGEEHATAVKEEAIDARLLAELKEELANSAAEHEATVAALRKQETKLLAEVGPLRALARELSEVMEARLKERERYMRTLVARWREEVSLQPVFLEWHAATKRSSISRSEAKTVITRSATAKEVEVRDAKHAELRRVETDTALKRRELADLTAISDRERGEADGRAAADALAADHARVVAARMVPEIANAKERLRKAQERIAAAKRPLPKKPSTPETAAVPQAELNALDKEAQEIRASLEAKQALLSQVQQDHDDTKLRLAALEASKNGPSAEAMRLERERQLLAKIHTLQETNAGLQSEHEKSVDERDALVREEERLGRRSLQGGERRLRKKSSLND
jgi:hypothetical protein